MFRRPSPTFARRFRAWALASAALATLILGSFGLSSDPRRQALAERAAPAAVESLPEEGWLRLRWQSLLPGMMK